MKDTYKKLLLVLLAIAIAAAAIFLVIKPLNEKRAKTESEINTLQTRYATLSELKANQAEYEAKIEENQALFDEKLGEFPSNLNQEYQIEFIQGVRNNEDITYNAMNLGMSEPTAFYVLGGTGDAAADPAAATADANGNVTTDGSADNYSCYTSIMAIDYEGSYSGIKNFVNYVAGYQYRMTIDSVSVVKKEEADDYFTGSMQVNIYCISGKDREEVPEIDLDDIKTGVENLFTGAGSSVQVSKYTDDNGEAIKSDYDLYVAVNPASSDASGKIVGLKSGNTVTSSKNEVEAVSIKVTQDGTTYTAEYGIGTEKKIQEFNPGDDLTLLVQSSDLKDATDTNAITLSIENSTDKTLYVKVADDATAARVKITNKAGNVVVYK